LTIILGKAVFLVRLWLHTLEKLAPEQERRGMSAAVLALVSRKADDLRESTLEAMAGWQRDCREGQEGQI